MGDAVAEAETDRRGHDYSARALVAQDALKLRPLTSELEDLVSRIAGHADVIGEDEQSKPQRKSYAAQYGLPDPDDLAARLSKLASQLSTWHTIYEVRSGTVDVLAGEPA